jgi:hypothetical protein
MTVISNLFEANDGYDVDDGCPLHVWELELTTGTADSNKLRTSIHKVKYIKSTQMVTLSLANSRRG